MTRDPCYTVTSKKFHKLHNAHIPMTDWPPCQLTIDPCYTITPALPIDHRSMLHHYTCPLPIDHTPMQHHYTPCEMVIGIRSVLKFTEMVTIITSLLKSSLLQESPSSLLLESFSSVKLSQFLQYLSKYALVSSSCFTTLNKEVWTWKDDWPPWRTSTYERPFTREGNYLVF